MERKIYRQLDMDTFNKAALEFRLKQAVKAKLIGQGFTLSEIYRDSEYKRAYDNFLKYLEDNYMIQIIEIEW